MTAADRDHLAAIVESSEDAIISKSHDGTVLSWNRGAERLYGYTALEAIGRDISFLVPPDRLHEIAANAAPREEGERIDHYETDRRCKDGRILRVSLSVAPVYAADGTVIASAAIARDATRDATAREALRKEGERLAISQRVAQVGSWDWDVASGAVIWSDELFRMYGVDPRTFEPSFEAFLECVHPDDRAAIAAEITAAVEQRRGFSTEHRVRRPDGSVRAMAARAEVSLDDDLKVVRMYGTSQDISESRALQDELRRQKETLELVALATNDAVWDWDVASGRVEWNHGLAAYGYAESDVLPTLEWWSARVHPDDLRRVEGDLGAVLASAETACNLEYRFLRKDGGYARVVDRSFVVREGDGAPRRMVGSMLDATQRDRAEELARRGVASAELLSRASHELRTPLNAILGFSDLLEQRLDPTLGPRERRYLQNVRGSGQHLLQLVDRLLQIAKADSGRLELHPSVSPLIGLVAPVYAEFSAAAAAAGISLDLDLPDAAIRVDLERMVSVLRELLANALAATPTGGSVIVRATIPDDSLVLEVIDSGRGIPEEARDHIFEVFQRIHEDGDPTHTGLGLALCRELVEAHGGTISFESEPGHRTTFRVELPHVAWRREKDDRVLIVDDEPNDADLAMALARDAGLRCEVVGTVAEARAAILRDTPTAIVLDLRLPDGSGNEVLEALRALGPLVPVAVVSAYDDPSLPHPGAVRMAKPLDPAELTAWLRRVTAPKVHV